MNKATFIRIESTKEIIACLRAKGRKEIGLEGIWEKDEDSLHTIDPQVIEWIVEGLIAAIPPLITYLAMWATTKKNEIVVKIPTVEVSLNIPPNMTDKQLNAVTMQVIDKVKKSQNIGDTT